MHYMLHVPKLKITVNLRLCDVHNMFLKQFSIDGVKHMKINLLDLKTISTRCR